MDVRDFECFIAVAETLNFRRAADVIHMTQPSLSQRIASLEDKVGVQLFLRDRRMVSLTPAGRAFLSPARIALAEARSAVRQAVRAERGEVGNLRLGFTLIASYSSVPNAIQHFRARYPDVEIALAEMDSPSLETALLQGKVDLAVLHPPLQAHGLEVRDLPDEEMVLALPTSFALAAREIVDIAALADVPMLTAPRAVGPALYDRFIALFRFCNMTPRIVQEVMPMTTLLALVAAGAGAGFVTRNIANVGRPGVVFRPVTPSPPSLPMAVAWPSGLLTATAARFVREEFNIEPELV